MKQFFTISFIALASCTAGQVTITGVVVDEKGKPVPMVNIFVDGTYDGTTADENGNFAFTTDQKGNVLLVARIIGYKDFSQSVLLEGETIGLTIKLKEQSSELTAVTITAGAFMASDDSRRTVFRAVDIATTAGATADIASALNTLPGTQKVGETGRLFVRGGDGDEARTFIDGLMVLDAYSPSAPNTPSRGRYLPFMFKGISFSTGGYSAEYGQALSAALVLNSKDESEITRTDFGLLSVGGDIAHTQAWKSGSAAAKVQYTNLRPYMNLIDQEIDWIIPPASVEGIGAVRQQIGETAMIKVYANVNTSNFSLYHHDIDDYRVKQLFSFTNNYGYFNTSYKKSFRDNWIIRGGVSYTSNRDDISIDHIDISELEKGTHGKIVFEGSFSDRLELKTGAEIIHSAYDRSIFSVGSFASGFDETISSAFCEADIYASDKFVTRAGARVEHNGMNNEWSIDPRFSLAYKTGTDSQVSFAYGKFRQSAKNEYLRVRPWLDAEKSDHFILNYQWIENNRTFRIETYYKNYKRLVKFQNGDASQLTNYGKGYAKGIELFCRDKQSVQNLDYWVSYSFLETERDYLNFPYASVPAFASRHNFSAVGKYFITDLKSQLGLTYSFASGRPYNNPNENKFNAGKTPSYHDLSFNWSYLPRPFLIVYFSCTNVLGRDNIFGYAFSPRMNERGVYNSRPIRQPALRFLFVGVFITLSKDKSMTQLPYL